MFGHLTYLCGNFHSLHDDVFFSFLIDYDDRHVRKDGHVTKPVDDSLCRCMFLDVLLAFS